MLGRRPERDPARAFWRLARVYESQNYLVSARDAYLQIQARYGRVRLAGTGPEEPLGDRVVAELARRPLAAIAAGPSPAPGSRCRCPGAGKSGRQSSRTIRVLSARACRPACSPAGRIWSREPGSVRSTRRPASRAGRSSWARRHLGRLPCRQGAGGDCAADRGPGPHDRGRAMAARAGDLPRGRAGLPIRLHGARPHRPARTVHGEHFTTFTWWADGSSVSAATRSSWPSTARAERSTGRSRAGRARSTPGSGSARSASCCRSRIPTSWWSWRPRPAARWRGEPWPRARRWSVPRCPSTRTTSCSCRTGGPSRSST